MPELPRPHIRTANDPGTNVFIEPTTDFTPTPSIAEQQELLYNSINKALKDDHLNYPSYQGEKQQYEGSDYKIKKYEELKEKDPLYAMFIGRKYGTYDNFLNKYGLDKTQIRVYNPMFDQKMDVTIITKDVFYKSDHISSQEIITEALYGICTVDYIDVNNRAQRLNGTLEKKYITTANIAERYNFFNPQIGKYGQKIILWNINKQKWSAFYLNRAVRFVKDDTIDLE